MCKGRDFPGGDGARDIQILLGRMAVTGEPGVLATVVAVEGTGPARAGSKLILLGDGQVSGTVGGGLAEAKVLDAARGLLQEGGCRLIRIEPDAESQECPSRMEVFLEFIQQGWPFYVIGSGHVARALLELGENLPFRFTVIDDHPDGLASIASETGVLTLAASPEKLTDQLAVVPGAAVLIATRGHDLDLAYLRAVLAAEDAAEASFSYLGLLGSTRKVDKFRRELAGNSQHTDRLKRAQMPVGLELGDASPHGIAISILAEALAVQNGSPFLLDDAGDTLGIRLHRRRDG